MYEVTTYHMLLRVSALVIAVVLVFDSGLLLPITRELSQHTQQYLGNAVSANARVAPTELNTLTAELTKQRQDLEEREAALSEREISIGLNTQSGTDTDLSTYILSLLLFIILVLIILNYVLDFVRARRFVYLEQHEQRT